ncbi:MAG TPA: uracil-DNA glycosylase [Clostridia bacterium]|nr:uracil-DNA glycosylase [Clostridia bacterium]HRU84083.1 uracil-DNA glycosylase [Eubacteriales bacterium]
MLYADFRSDKYVRLRESLVAEYRSGKVYPPADMIYRALKLTPYEEVKAVILGQDPYHGAGQAHGLCFSVPEGIECPPSLINIFKELESDLKISAPRSGNLEKWAKEGVLLLNASLTVRAGQPMSHAKLGWEALTDAIISKLNLRKQPLVFILWGAFARSKKMLITLPHHLILESAHPSPLSAHNGFFGSRPFSKTNDFLIKNNIFPIDWRL